MELDHPRHIAHGKALLASRVASGSVAVEGDAGDRHTFNVCNELLDIGCLPTTALDLMLEDFNPHCQPPWNADELAAKMANAVRYRQNEIGCDARRPMAEVFSGVEIPSEHAPTDAKEKDAMARLFRVRQEWEMYTEAKREELFPGFMFRAVLGGIVAETQHFKSFNVMGMAMSVCTGLPYLGFTPLLTGTVVYAALEGLDGVCGQRRIELA